MNSEIRKKCFIWKWSRNVFLNKESIFPFRKFRKKHLFSLLTNGKSWAVGYVSGEPCSPLKYYCSLLAWIDLILSFWDETFLCLYMTLNNFCLIREQTVFCCKVPAILAYTFKLPLIFSLLFKIFKIMTGYNIPVSVLPVSYKGVKSHLFDY